MAYDGMYGELSTRGTTNEILTEVREVAATVELSELNVIALEAATVNNAALAAGSATIASGAAGTAASNATIAQNAASAAETARIAAQAAAAQAVVNSEAALVVANTANTKSDAAVATANGAEATANGIDAKATTALSNSVTAVNTANTANTNANAAVTTANGIDAKATTALSNSVTAVNTANTANTRNTDAITEGTTNLYFTQNRVRATAMTGLSVVTGTPVVAADTTIVAIGKLQKQNTDEITNRTSAITTAVAAAVGNRGGVNRNILDNSDFRVQQRGLTAVTNAVNGTYWVDRWQCVGTTSATVAQWGQGASSGQGGSAFQWTMVITLGTVQQIVPEEYLSNGSYTISWFGTAPLNIYRQTNSTFTTVVTGATSPYTFNFDPDAANSKLILRWGVGRLERPQLERGSVATEYEPRPPAVEWAACQRFYARVFGLGMNAPYCSAAGQAMSIRIPWPVQMRSYPAVTFITPNIGTYLVQSYNFDSPNVSCFRAIMFSSTANNGFSFDFPAGDGRADYVQGSCEL